jgi:hypothetical protein
MKYTKQLTHKQFDIHQRQQCDSNYTDWLLRHHGLNPNTFAKLDLKVVQAKIAAHELEKKYSKYLTEANIEKIKAFNRKVANPKKGHLLKSNAAYPILNMATKIKRQAYQAELITRQKIQALRRYNQP